MQQYGWRRGMEMAGAQLDGRERYCPKTWDLATAVESRHRPKAAQQHRKSRGFRDDRNTQIVDISGVGRRAQFLPLKHQGEIAVATQRSRAHIEVIQECGRFASI